MRDSRDGVGKTRWRGNQIYLSIKYTIYNNCYQLIF